MTLGMFGLGIIARQVTAIDVLNNAIQLTVSHTVSHDDAQTAMNAVASQWQAIRAQFDPNLGMLTDDQATQYINALQNILNRSDAIIAQDAGVSVSTFTPYAVAGGTGGTGINSNEALIQNRGDYQKYVTPGSTSATPMPSPRLDPTKPGPDKTAVQLSTVDQIKSISDSIFGAVSSGAKQFFEIKALQMASRGQPVNVPNSPATQAEIMGTGTKVAIGVGGVLLIGALVFAISRR